MASALSIGWFFMMFSESENLYIFGLVRADLEDLHRRERHLRRLIELTDDRQKVDALDFKLARVLALIDIAVALQGRLAGEICLVDLREKAKDLG